MNHKDLAHTISYLAKFLGNNYAIADANEIFPDWELTEFLKGVAQIVVVYWVQFVKFGLGCDQERELSLNPLQLLTADTFQLDKS